MSAKIKKHFTSSQIIIFGFAGAIILGTILLMLPISSASGNMTPFSDALFTVYQNLIHPEFQFSGCMFVFRILLYISNPSVIPVSLEVSFLT